MLGAHTWAPPREWLGGLSGLEMASDGGHALALGDRAGLVELTFERSADGRIIGVSYEGVREVDQIGADTEGLAIAADGTINISLEIVPRLLRWTPGQHFPTSLPLPQDFGDLRGNAGLEGLAISGDGALWTLAEAPDWSGNYALWRGLDGQWSKAGDIPGGGAWPLIGYRAVGLDFDDRGRLYLLERRLALRIGFQSRVRRITLDEGRIGAIETLIETAPRDHDNLEGISAWRDAQGRLRLTLVSDDNYAFFQRTEFVEYAVPD